MNKKTCPHNNVESNMCPAYCRDCKKILAEPIEEKWCEHNKNIGGNYVRCEICNSSLVEIKDWEEKLRGILLQWDGEKYIYKVPDLVEFIRSQSELLKEKLRGMERHDAWLNGFNVDMTNGYNQALSDALSIIDKENI